MERQDRSRCRLLAERAARTGEGLRRSAAPLREPHHHERGHPPRTWLTFGQFQQGQVLDIGAIINSAKIDFPAGVYAITVTLNGDDTFTVSP